MSEAFCPECGVERADYEKPNAHLPTCPNCGTAEMPALRAEASHDGQQREPGESGGPAARTSGLRSASTSALEKRDEVIALLREAERVLMAASYAATYSEGDRTGLQGAVTLLIGGLGQAVSSLADHLEETA